MTTFFDTSVLIEHLRGEPKATACLLAVPRSDRFISVLTRVEIEGGMQSNERRDVAALFGVLELVPVTDVVARRAAQHLRTYRRSHGDIDLVDYVIAASAELQRADLATLNIKHFPMFKGLKRPW